MIITVPDRGDRLNWRGWVQAQDGRPWMVRVRRGLWCSTCRRWAVPIRGAGPGRPHQHRPRCISNPPETGSDPAQFDGDVDAK